MLVLILLVLIYRSPIFWTIPFFTVLFAEVCARGFGYLLAEAGVTINGQSGGILPVLVFGAGTDYALLLVSRYREELRRHDSKHEAMQIALRNAGPAILASGLTVMAALLVLVFAEVNGTAGLGPIGAMGVGLAMIFMLTMLPAALVIAGRRAFWPFVPDGPGRAAAAAPQPCAPRGGGGPDRRARRRRGRGRRRRRGRGRARPRRPRDLLPAGAGLPPPGHRDALSAGSSARWPRATGSPTRPTASGGGSATASRRRRAGWRSSPRSRCWCWRPGSCS